MRYAWRTDRQMDRMTDNTTTVCRRSAPRHNNNKGIFSWDFPEFEFSAPPGRLYTISIKTPFSDFHHKWVQGVRSDLNITLAQSNLANVTTNLRPVRTSNAHSEHLVCARPHYKSILRTGSKLNSMRIRPNPHTHVHSSGLKPVRVWAWSIVKMAAGWTAEETKALIGIWGEEEVQNALDERGPLEIRMVSNDWAGRLMH